MTTPPAAALTWHHFPAGPNGFFRAPVLITGSMEAMLIDGSFTLSDGRAVAEAVRRTGKRLTTIYVSQSDPDYYFSLGPIKEAFPAQTFVFTDSLLAIRSSCLHLWHFARWATMNSVGESRMSFRNKAGR
jgi:glyoxylase-like metal-dependent hydrolase (beta-lactamase superfamily II)